MTIPFLTNWSPMAKLAGLAAALTTFVGIVTGFGALAETVIKIQPFATKAMVLAQNMAVNQSIEDLRWDQIAYGIDNLQFQLGQKRFQLIQLEELIDADPNDQIKKLKADLTRDIELTEQRLERLRCEFEQRGRTDRLCQ